MDQERIHRLRWGTLAVLSVSLIILNLDSTILNVALPTLVRDLHSTSSQLQWIVDSYILVFAGLLLTGGSLGDRLGRKWVFMTGLALFGIGSIASAFSHSSDVLIATRAFMGIGGALAMPATLSIITNVFVVPGERAKAIAIWSGSSGVGVALGPILGGWLLSHFWWGSVFLVNGPVVVLGIIGAALVVPNSKDLKIPKPDPIGSLLSVASLGTILWSIIEAPTKGWTSNSILTGFVVGAVLLVTFIVVELRSSHPMLRLSFFSNPRFSFAALSIAISFFSLGGVSFLLTQYLQFARGYTPLRAGVLFIPLAVALLIFAPVSARLAHLIGTKITVAFGLTLGAVATLMMVGFTLGSSLWAIELPLGILGLSIAFTMPPSAEAVMGSVPRTQAGVGSATNGTLIQIGGALGVAVLGSVLSTDYGSSLSGSAIFKSVPSAVQLAAKSSLGSTLITASHLPLAPAKALVVAGRTSFISGFSATIPIAVAVVFGGAIIALLALPSRHRGDPNVFIDDLPVVGGDESSNSDVTNTVGGGSSEVGEGEIVG